MIFARRFSSKGHTRQFCVERDPRVGWAAREEADNEVVQMIRCRDWHRVERMIALFDHKASDLRDQGWQEVACNASQS